MIYSLLHTINNPLLGAIENPDTQQLAQCLTAILLPHKINRPPVCFPVQFPLQELQRMGNLFKRVHILKFLLE